MPHSHRDRRPGIFPPEPPAPKGPRFAGLSRPKSKFFDLRTTVFLMAGAWLCFYSIDRLWFEGNGNRAVKDGFAIAKGYFQR